QLRQPERLIRLGNPGQIAVLVAMPEAAMHENDLAFARKNQIRLAGERSVVQSIAEPRAMQQPPNEHFRPGVFPPDQGHDATALTDTKGIHHAESCPCLQGSKTSGAVVRHARSPVMDSFHLEMLDAAWPAIGWRIPASRS